MVTTVRDNSPQSINTSLFSLQKEIDELKRQIDRMNAELFGKGSRPGTLIHYDYRTENKGQSV